MEDVEPLGFLFWEGGGHDRIDEGFYHSVGNRDQKEAPVESFAGLSEKGQKKRGDVTAHRDVGRGFVADLVDDEAEDNDADGKGPEADPENASLVGFAETKFGLPVADDTGAEPEDK